jgi:hypothetical protein
MRTQVALIAAFGVGVVLSGCAPGSVYGVSNTIAFAYPTMGFAGTYCKQLTVDDVRQIVRLAKDRPDVLKPVDQIVVDHPDEAEVHTGNPQTSGDPARSFHARKRNGRWFISDKPYCTRETIITS